jgi:pimeloyl-ACP methyl ester carboxylesterase
MSSQSPAQRSRSIFNPCLVIALFATAAMLLVVHLGTQNASAAEQIKGSMVAYQTAVEKKKCQPKKGITKATCLRTAKAKATAKTRQMMSSPNGLYGYGIRAAAIPNRNGTLIWNKKYPTTPGARRTDMVLYSSKSFPGNKKIVVSGTMSIPQGTPPVGGWPVISWAHGTTGLADSCAPSRGSDQGSYGGAEPLVQGWLESGYAVLATDYEGLGTPGIHPYLIGDSEGRGVLDIVRAARTADPKLSRKVIVAGHSQGGHAALFAAKLAPQWASDFDHLGTVPYAPPADFQLQAAGIGALPSDAYGISALATSILRGAVAGDPSIDPAAILTEEAYQHYSKTETMCLGELGQEFASTGTGPGDLLRPGILFQPAGESFSNALAEMNPLIETDRPVLIVQGRQDTTVQPGLTDTLATRLGNLNPGLVEYTTYGQCLVSGLDPCVGVDPEVQIDSPSTHSSILLDAGDEVDAFLRQVLDPDQ